MARWFRRSGGDGAARQGAAAPPASAEEPLALADRLRLEYGRTGDPALLVRAAQAAETAAGLYPAEDLRHASALSALCVLHRLRWEHERDTRLLERSLEYGRRSVEDSPPGDENLPRHMSALATSLQESFDQGGRQQDIDEAIVLYRACLDLLPGDHAERAGIESNLANSLLRRARKYPDPAVLDEAVRHARAALAATPPDDPMHAARLVNLGGVLFSLAQSGQLNHLIEAHEMYERGLRGLPRGHPARGQVEGAVRRLRQLRQRFGF